jgi:predicted RNase H-like HicB family nuclease
MIAKLLLKPLSQLAPCSLTVLIEEKTEGTYQAIVLGLPDCKAEGNTRQEAVTQISQAVSERLEKAELISLEIQQENQQEKPVFPSLTVFIERKNDETYRAIVLGLSDCKAEGITREEALRKISTIVGDRLEKAELISLEIPFSKPEHPWMKFAGMFQDDLQFDEMLEDIQTLRRERDADMEVYYQKLDVEEVAK